MQGWKLVPLEPTQEMMDAMQSSGWALGNYRDMLAAAPEAPGELPPLPEATRFHIPAGDHTDGSKFTFLFSDDQMRDYARAAVAAALSAPAGEPDSARLDWLQGNPGAVTKATGYAVGKATTPDDSWGYKMANGGFGFAPTIREAIDRAMAEAGYTRPSVEQEPTE